MPEATETLTPLAAEVVKYRLLQPSDQPYRLDPCTVGGELDLSAQIVRSAVFFRGVTFADRLVCAGTSFLHSVHFEGCCFPRGFSFAGAKVNGDLVFHDCAFALPNEARAELAEWLGGLRHSQPWTRPPRACLIDFEAIEVEGKLDLRRSTCEGALQFTNARVEKALILSGLQCAGSVFAEGAVIGTYAEWDTDYAQCRRTLIGGALNAANMRIGASAFLGGIVVGHSLRLHDARIDGRLVLAVTEELAARLRHASAQGPADPVAPTASPWLKKRLRAALFPKGGWLSREDKPPVGAADAAFPPERASGRHRACVGANADGESVRLTGAHLAANLELSGAVLEGALMANGCHVHGAVLAQPSTGQVAPEGRARTATPTASGTTAGEANSGRDGENGNLDAEAGRVERAVHNDPPLPFVVRAGGVHFYGAEITGEARFCAAQIHGDLDLTNGRVGADLRLGAPRTSGANGCVSGVVRLRGTDVRGDLVVQRFTLGSGGPSPSQVTFDLRQCHVHGDCRLGQSAPLDTTGRDADATQGSGSPRPNTVVHGSIAAQELRAEGDLRLRQVEVGGSVDLEDAQVAGEINLLETLIHGDLWLMSAKVRGRVFTGDAASTGAAVPCPLVKGNVRFDSASLSEVLMRIAPLENAKPDATAGLPSDGAGTAVAGGSTGDRSLWEFRPKRISLDHARVGRLVVSGELPPEQRPLFSFSGLQFDDLDAEGIETASSKASARRPLALFKRCCPWLAAGFLGWLLLRCFAGLTSPLSAPLALVPHGVIVAVLAVASAVLFGFWRKEALRQHHAVRLLDQASEVLDEGSYAAVEKWLRNGGADEAADAVYLRLRAREFLEDAGSWLRALAFVPTLTLSFFLLTRVLGWGRFVSGLAAALAGWAAAYFVPWAGRKLRPWFIQGGPPPLTPKSGTLSPTRCDSASESGWGEGRGEGTAVKFPGSGLARSPTPSSRQTALPPLLREARLSFWNWTLKGTMLVLLGCGVRVRVAVTMWTLLFLLTAWLFSVPTAVEHPLDFGAPTVSLLETNWFFGTPGGPPTQAEWGWGGGLWMAARLQLPAIDILARNDWEPASGPIGTRSFTTDLVSFSIKFGALRYDDYAASVSLISWVLLPLILAAATGLIKGRRDR